MERCPRIPVRFTFLFILLVSRAGVGIPTTPCPACVTGGGSAPAHHRINAAALIGMVCGPKLRVRASACIEWMGVEWCISHLLPGVSRSCCGVAITPLTSPCGCCSPPSPSRPYGCSPAACGCFPLVLSPWKRHICFFGAVLRGMFLQQCRHTCASMHLCQPHMNHCQP